MPKITINNLLPTPLFLSMAISNDYAEGFNACINSCKEGIKQGIECGDLIINPPSVEEIEKIAKQYIFRTIIPSQGMDIYGTNEETLKKMCQAISDRIKKGGV